MVNSRCVPGCRTSYKSNKSSKKVVLFKFSTNIKLHNIWVKAISKKNWRLCNSRRVCAKHFCKEDLKANLTDTCVTRKNSRPTSTLQRF